MEAFGEHLEDNLHALISELRTRTYPDRYLHGALGLTCLYALRRDFLREFAAQRHAGNRPVERSAGDPHATFVRGTEAPC